MSDIITMQTATNLIAALPKTEIHLHLEGLASIESIWTLKQKHHLNLGFSSKEELKQRFRIQNLNEFLNIFINIVQACFVAAEDIDLLMDDALHYLQRNNVVYAEIFFAPTKFLKNGINFSDIVHHLNAGAARIEKHGITVRFIVDVSRGFGVDNAKQNLDLTLQNRSDVIIGLGIGGAERTGPARLFIPVFKSAIEHGLHVVAHAGEDIGPESIWDAINLLHVERIGHGTSAFLDPHLMGTLKERKIPLEICPTSNLFTGKYVKTLRVHPVRRFFDYGLFITINTDDPALFGTELNAEYIHLLTQKIFSLREIIAILRNGIYATFLTNAQKHTLWNRLQETLKITLSHLTKS